MLAELVTAATDVEVAFGVVAVVEADHCIVDVIGIVIW